MWEGALARVPESLEGWFLSPQFATFRVVPGKLEIGFLDWYCKQSHVWDSLRDKARGMGARRDSVSPGRFLELVIPLPPLPEQRRIVARIEELSAKIEEARTLREQTKEQMEASWRSALFRAFQPEKSFRRSGQTAQQLLDYQAAVHKHDSRDLYNGAHPWAPHNSEDGPYPLPSHWTWTDLGSVLTRLVDCINDTPDFADSGTGYIGLKSTNIRPYKLDLTSKWWVTQEDFKWWNRRQTPQDGDIVLTREAPMGNACILTEGFQFCLTQRLMLLRNDENFVRRRYVLHYLNSTHFSEQVLELCRGLTTPHIRVQDAPLIRVPLSPRDEQDHIVAYLDSLQAKVDVVKRLQEETEEELNALMPSILSRAFSGQL